MSKIIDVTTAGVVFEPGESPAHRVDVAAFTNGLRSVSRELCQQQPTAQL